MKSIDVFGQKMQLSPNPMTGIYGYAPGVSILRAGETGGSVYDGPQCGECVFFLRGRKSYHKCRKRGITNGPGTDHRVRWPACGLFEEREPE